MCASRKPEGASPIARIGHAVRPLVASDEEAVYRICLRTGADGGDASGLYADPRLLGHIYAGPYVRLAPEYGFVVEDEEGVGGYILGTADTLAFEARLEVDWWPALRRRYPPPEKARRSAWTADEMRIWQIHHPWRTPEAMARPFPAHLHIDLLPRLQGRGLGSVLMAKWRELMRSRGVNAAHLGVSLANKRAIRFYEKEGWRRIGPEVAGDVGGAWYGVGL